MHTGTSTCHQKMPEGYLDKALQLLLVLACGALYLWWAYHLPVDLAPDEDLRLRIPFFIFDHGSLPTIFDAEAYAAPFDGSTYAAQPFGSSLVAVAFMKLMSLIHNTPTALVLLRGARAFFSACLPCLYSCALDAGHLRTLPLNSLWLCLWVFFRSSPSCHRT